MKTTRLLIATVSALVVGMAGSPAYSKGGRSGGGSSSHGGSSHARSSAHSGTHSGTHAGTAWQSARPVQPARPISAGRPLSWWGGSRPVIISSLYFPLLPAPYY